MKPFIAKQKLLQDLMYCSRISYTEYSFAEYKVTSACTKFSARIIRIIRGVVLRRATLVETKMGAH